ncbi:WSC domain-containing protein [Pterulicium gracile]|uniref:WSC domain-containing protein n=1 Tax=Pterulicium gracile TaxID=1884261 RepID=A0A5C3Q2N3_9AGAR|nr:WSC domain-containing protein [Pterula gracilis]
MFFRALVASLAFTASIVGAVDSQVIDTSSQEVAGSISARQNYLGYNSQGCYAHGWMRTLNGIMPINGNSLIPNDCIHECNRHGYTYAGIENGIECYCDWKMRANPTPVPQSDCYMACPGNNGATTCGGPGRMQIFARSPAFPAPYADPRGNGHFLWGCYTDTIGSRTLPSFILLLSYDMTVRRCTMQCQQAGFWYSGMENGNECYCGKAINPTGQRVALGECDMACTGATGENCGGANRILIYGQGPGPN